MRVLVVLAVILLVGGTGWYLIECWWYPWARCWWCRGAGKHSRQDRLVWRSCRVCRGTGSRLRVGRRLWLAMRGRRSVR